jgi:aconitase A
VVRGPNIKPFPLNQPLPAEMSGKVLLKVADNITTDDIMPSNAKLLPYRSNIPHLAEYCLTPCDPDFLKEPKRNKEDLSLRVTTMDKDPAESMPLWHHYSWGSRELLVNLLPVSIVPT